MDDFALTFARFRYPQYPDLDMGWGWMLRPCGHFTQEGLLFYAGQAHMLPLTEENRCLVCYLSIPICRWQELRN